MASKDKSEGQPIELSKLSLQNLTQIKKILDSELSVFQESLQALKMAQGKYAESKESLEKITPECKGAECMIPITGTVYVPGAIEDVEHVLVDVGTGYYINMNMDSARDYFKRKVAFITEQIEKIQVIGFEKSKSREAIMDVMDAKIQAQMAAYRNQKPGVSA